MKAIKTKKGGYLVTVNKYYGCYTDAEGNFLRSVDNIEEEVIWALDAWENKEIIDFPYEQLLLNQVAYIQEYKNSLKEVEPS